MFKQWNVGMFAFLCNCKGASLVNPLTYFMYASINLQSPCGKALNAPQLQPDIWLEYSQVKQWGQSHCELHTIEKKQKGKYFSDHINFFPSDCSHNCVNFIFWAFFGKQRKTLFSAALKRESAREPAWQMSLVTKAETTLCSSSKTTTFRGCQNHSALSSTPAAQLTI